MTKRSKLTIFGASAAALALALSACGAQSSGDLSKVKYTLKNATAEPEASFATPFAASSPSAYVIEEGNGESINDGDYVLVEAAVFNGTDGKLNGSTYSSEPILLPINDQLKQAAPQVYETLKKIKVGGSFSYTTNVLQQRSTAGVTTTTASPGAATNVEVYTVKTKLPKYATGKAVEADPSLPSFTLDESTGKAEIKLPDNKPEVTELTAKTLVEGEGPEVKETDTVYVRYIGVQYSDGKVVDGNYAAATPMGISLQGVIKGWTQGLKGKKVGSRVELVIPADLAYGNDTGGSKPSGTLVFVVDILGAEENPQTLQRAQAASSAAAAEASASATAEASATATPAATASATAQ